MQESGRAGRDGAQSTAFLLYQGMQLMHVDKDMKDYVKSKECRRKHLLSYFDMACPPLDLLHLCCDNCSVSCKCGLEDCKPLCYPLSLVFQWSSLRTNSNSKIIAGSRGVARVCECHILSVNFTGQQQNKSFDVMEIVLAARVRRRYFRRNQWQPETRLRSQATRALELLM